MVTAKELITYAADMFRKNPERWGQGTLAQSDDGTPVNIDDNQARKFCLLGGLKFAGHTLGNTYGEVFHCAAAALRDTLVKRGEGRSLGYWNDQPSRKVEEVVELLDTAAARVKG